MADPRFRLETDKFNRAMREMQSRLGGKVSLEKLVDFEVSKVIEMALKSTDTATVASIRQSVEEREYITISGKKYKLSNWYPNPVWRSIQAHQKASLMRKLAARGLSKRQWLALAEQVGFTISAPGYVQAAETPKHTPSENVDTKRKYSETGYGLAVTNKFPLNRWTGARAAFFSAVVGRRKYYEQNLARGVFGDLAKVAKKYPGLTVGPA